MLGRGCVPSSDVRHEKSAGGSQDGAWSWRLCFSSCEFLFRPSSSALFPLRWCFCLWQSKGWERKGQNPALAGATVNPLPLRCLTSTSSQHGIFCRCGEVKVSVKGSCVGRRERALGASLEHMPAAWYSLFERGQWARGLQRPGQWARPTQ